MIKPDDALVFIIKTHNMVIRFNIFFLLIILAWGLVSCEKERQAVEEQPFFLFFDDAAIQIDTTPAALSTWEYGFVFQPLTNGKITKLGMKLPVLGAFKLRLWDLTGPTPAVIAEKTLSAGAAHAEIFADISPVAVATGDNLGVTIEANAFYRIQKQDGGNFVFPREVKNIRILSFNENTNETGMPAFPQTPNPMRVAPCVNVVFVAD
ncbi:MAG: hypothetical protein ACR2K1_05055 [Saprospiraceae bacterium]